MTKLHESRPVSPVRIGSKIFNWKAAAVAGNDLPKNDLPKTVSAIFEERVSWVPEAVVYEGAGPAYRDLNEPSNGLAHCLIGMHKGVCICRPQPVFSAKTHATPAAVRRG